MDELLLDLAQSALMPLVVVVLTALDSIFPPVPSEMIVVALAAIGMAKGLAYLVPLICLAAIGAFGGDCLAYWIGRKVPIQRLRYLQRPGVAAAYRRAHDALNERGAAILLAARYVPVGRVVANMAAGAVGMRFGRFMRIDVIGSLTWATYTVGLGALAGAWLGGNPVLAALCGIVLGIVVGAILDRAIRWRQARRGLDLAEPDPADGMVGRLGQHKGGA